jgi:CHAD domain-containing protein
LARLHSKLLKRGKHLAILAPHQRHELRIDLKKLRYGADLFAPVFAGRERTRTYLKAAAVLQEQLGLFNDQMVAAEIVGQLETADSRAAGMILGWCSRGAMADDGRLRESWREFRKVKLFWA